MDSTPTQPLAIIAKAAKSAAAEFGASAEDDGAAAGADAATHLGTGDRDDLELDDAVVQEQTIAGMHGGGQGSEADRGASPAGRASPAGIPGGLHF